MFLLFPSRFNPFIDLPQSSRTCVVAVDAESAVFFFYYYYYYEKSRSRRFQEFQPHSEILRALRVKLQIRISREPVEISTRDKVCRKGYDLPYIFDAIVYKFLNFKLNV